MRKPTLFLTLLLLALSPLTQATQIALIIDDMGNKAQDADAFALPNTVTFAILPHTPFSTTYSERSAMQAREVMLHIPMESLGSRALGPGAITSEMHPHIIEDELSRALESVPHAVGLNNHMGSKLTQLTLPMKTTMSFLQRRNLYFVDSRTTRFSKAADIATEYGIDVASRNVFLDHQASPAFIDGQFKRLVRIAKKYGSAVGIGHPYPETIEYLKNNLAALSEQNIRLVAVSELFDSPQIAKVAKETDAEVSPQE